MESLLMPQEQSAFVSREDFIRLEGKLDRVSESINRLVLIEERQTNQGTRMGNLEQRVTRQEERQEGTDKKLDAWINRGIGIWVVVSLLATVAWNLLKH